MSVWNNRRREKTYRKGRRKSRFRARNVFTRRHKETASHTCLLRPRVIIDYLQRCSRRFCKRGKLLTFVNTCAAKGDCIIILRVPRKIVINVIDFASPYISTDLLNTRIYNIEHSYISSFYHEYSRVYF